MGLTYIGPWVQEWEDNNYSIMLSDSSNTPVPMIRIFPTSEYDLFIPLNWIYTETSFNLDTLDHNKQYSDLTLVMNKNNQLLISNLKGNKISFDLQTFVEQFPAGKSIHIAQEQAEQLILTAQGQGLEGKLYLMSLEIIKNNMQIVNMSGELLLKFIE